jgi:hypothetical protein
LTGDVPAIHNQQSPYHLGKTGPEYGYRIAQLIVAGGDGRHVSRIPPGAFGPLTKKKSKIKIQMGAATMPAAQLSRTGKTKILRLWLWLALPQNPPIRGPLRAQLIDIRATPRPQRQKGRKVGLR